MSDIIIWLIIFFVFIIIIGLYISEYTPIQLNQKDKILSLQENFSPSVSSPSDQLEGASQLYNWGVPNNTKFKDDINDEDLCDDIIPKKIYIKEKPKNEVCIQKKNTQPSCYECDITVNKNIDKYVLKSSVPSCPDMSEYITKNMINANVDLNDYILKSEIKACEKIDTSNYILKSKIPACPTCPTCPKCPTCPTCPKCPECKKLNDFDIRDHKDISKYISKDEVNKNYILKKNQQNNNSKLDDDHRRKRDDDDHRRKRDDDDHRKNDNNKIINSINNNRKKSDDYDDDHRKKSDDDRKKSDDDRKKSDDDRKKSDDDHKNFNYLLNDINKKTTYKSELLNNNVTGFYAGDSLFAGV